MIIVGETSTERFLLKEFFFLMTGRSEKWRLEAESKSPLPNFPFFHLLPPPSTSFHFHFLSPLSSFQFLLPFTFFFHLTILSIYAIFYCPLISRLLSQVSAFRMAGILVPACCYLTFLHFGILYIWWIKRNLE